MVQRRVAAEQLVDAVIDVMEVGAVLGEHDAVRFFAIVGQRRTVPAMPDTPARAADGKVDGPRVEAQTSAVLGRQGDVNAEGVRGARHRHHLPNFVLLTARAHLEVGAGRGLQAHASEHAPHRGRAHV
jgi:hypothetical protein